MYLLCFKYEFNIYLQFWHNKAVVFFNSLTNLFPFEINIVKKTNKN